LRHKYNILSITNGKDVGGCFVPAWSLDECHSQIERGKHTCRVEVDLRPCPRTLARVGSR